MNFTLGTCFKNTNPPPPPQHYWFVLSNPTAENCVYIANITGWDDFYGDGSCRLSGGEHTCITKDSYVNYSDSKIVQLSDLEGVLKSGMLSIQEKACDGLLQLMQQGALESEFCKNRFKKLLAAQNLPRVTPD